MATPFMVTYMLLLPFDDSEVLQRKGSTVREGTLPVLDVGAAAKVTPACVADSETFRT
jgi:hypothetical protein